VHLERAVRPFQRDIGGGQLQRVLAGDLDTEPILAAPPQATIEHPVSRQIGHCAGTEVSLAERGQNADERGTARVVFGGVGHPVNQQVQLAAERGERPPSQRGW